MKVRIIIFLVLVNFGLYLHSENQQVISSILNWKGVEKSYLNSSFVKFISFDGAQYPSENRLPYFNKRLVADPAFTYNAVLKNVIFIPVTNEENLVLDGIQNQTSVPEVKTMILQSRGINYLDITVLPFVSRDGKIFKLKSFDLQIDKQLNPQKSIK